MAQDIVITGDQFFQVPSIVVPTVGGGEAQFFDMSGEMAWMGKDAECIDDSFYTFSDTIDNTGFNGWTPSTSAKSIVATKTAGTFVADTDDYEYYIVWKCKADVEYDGTETQKALALFARNYTVQQLFKRPSSWANIQAEVYNGNVCATVLSANFLRYYGTTTGSITYSWGVSYGFYYAAQAATFSSSTSNTPTVTVKTPVFYSRCSTTYFSTGNAAKVVQDQSTWSMDCSIYRVKTGGILRGAYEQVTKFLNE